MALTTLIPEIVSPYLLGALTKSSVILPLANPEIKAGARIGDVVHVNTIPKLTAGAYSGTVTDAEAASVSYDFNIDQKYYNSVLLRDEQVGQSILTSEQLVVKYTEAEIAALTDAADGYLAGLYSTFAPIGTNSSAIDCSDGTKALAALRSIKTKMDQNSIPSTGRWVVVGPTFAAHLLAGATALFTQNNEAAINGVIGKIYGMEVRMSNNIKSDSAADEVLIAGYSESLAYAHNVSTIETMRSPHAFGTIVRGLYVFGGLALGATSGDVRGVALFANT